MKNIHKLILAAVLAGMILLAFMMFSKKSKFGADKVSPIDSNKITNDTVFIVFAPWCGHCVNAKEEFEKAEQKGNGKVKLIDATNPANEQLLEKLKVKGFPSIVKANGTKFSGSRTSEDILKFADDDN